MSYIVYDLWIVLLHSSGVEMTNLVQTPFLFSKGKDISTKGILVISLWMMKKVTGLITIIADLWRVTSILRYHVVYV